MGLLERLGIVKAAPIRNPSDEPTQAPYNVSYNKKATTVYKQVIMAEEALKHPVLFRILNKLAESVQAVEWYAEEIPGRKASKRDIEKLNDLLASPNDSMSAGQLRYWLALTYAAYRRVPIKIGKGAGGVVNAIYPLRNDWVFAKTDKKGMIVSYEYGDAQNKTSQLSFRKAGKEDAFIYEIFAVPLNASLDGTKSMSPLETLGMPAEVTKMLLQRAADTASGHPNVRYVITAEKTLTDSQKRALTDHLENSGPEDDMGGYTLFLYNTKIEVHKLDNNLSDIHTKIPTDDMIRLMAGTYGVPIALVGLGGADAAKFAGNYLESRISFWEDTIIPGYLVPLEGGLTQALCGKDSNIRIRFDRDSIPALNDARVRTAVQLSQVTFLDQNEKRQLVGFTPTDKIIEDPAKVTITPAMKQRMSY